jgi:hypothetical protein
MPKEADPLAFLLALNLSLAAKEKNGEPITAPGLVLSPEEQRGLVSNDCIRAAEA